MTDLTESQEKFLEESGILIGERSQINKALDPVFDALETVKLDGDASLVLKGMASREKQVISILNYGDIGFICEKKYRTETLGDDLIIVPTNAWLPSLLPIKCLGSGRHHVMEQLFERYNPYLNVLSQTVGSILGNVHNGLEPSVKLVIPENLSHVNLHLYVEECLVFLGLSPYAYTSIQRDLSFR